MKGAKRTAFDETQIIANCIVYGYPIAQATYQIGKTVLTGLLGTSRVANSGYTRVVQLPQVRVKLTLPHAWMLPSAHRTD